MTTVATHRTMPCACGTCWHEVASSSCPRVSKAHAPRSCRVRGHGGDHRLHISRPAPSGRLHPLPRAREFPSAADSAKAGVPAALRAEVSADARAGVPGAEALVAAALRAAAAAARAPASGPCHCSVAWYRGERPDRRIRRGRFACSAIASQYRPPRLRSATAWRAALTPRQPTRKFAPWTTVLDIDGLIVLTDDLSTRRGAPSLRDPDACSTTSR